MYYKKHLANLHSKSMCYVHISITIPTLVTAVFIEFTSEQHQNLDI